MNRDTAAALAYHDATKHSLLRLRTNRHTLDWENKPHPFKVYPTIEPLPLPRELPPSRVPALAAIAQSEVPVGDQPHVPDLAALARVLHFSSGITRKKVYPGAQDQYFRAAACTGALYHVDLYVVCGELPGLAAGVYHFGPHNFALHELRAGDYRGVLVEATSAEASVAHAPVIIACASTYWRNSWKYQSRAYRHCFWDAGTILANLLAVAAAGDLPTRVVCGFVDDTVSRLLGLDPAREGPLALVSLGYEPRTIAAHAEVPPLSVETLPLSAHEVDYPLIRDMQAASLLPSPEDVRAWRGNAVSTIADRPPSGQTFALRPLGERAQPTESIDAVILRRGSTREFAPVPISFEQLSTILDCATQEMVTDYGVLPTDLYLIVNAVAGLPPCTYVYHRGGALEALRAGTFRSEAGFLGLGQELAADASANIYFLSNLEPILARFGNRGYRIAQLDAAITAGKMYLAAYALRLGATGLTFLDDDVTDFFAPHAAGKSVMFLLAVGRGKKA